MKSKYSYLSKNVLLFAISSFAPKLLSIILVPIYTGYLTTAEYGTADLITTTVALLIPIFTLDIQDAVMRFALDKKYRHDDVFSVALRILLIGTAMVLVGVAFVVILNIEGLKKSYLVFFAVNYVNTALYNNVSLFCRGIDKVKTMVVGGIINSVVTLVSNVLFLTVFHWGLNGYLLANSLGAAVALLYCILNAEIYRYVKFNIPKQLHKEMVAFSFPLIFSVLAWWVNNALDRYMITWLCGVAASGLYAISYKIPSLLTVFQNIFTQAWSISAVKDFDKDDSDSFIRNTYTTLNCALTIICSGCMIVNIPVAKILYSNEFFTAWHYVPPLLISVVFNAMALFIGSIFTAVKDTKTLSRSTLIGAAANIVFNVILISAFEAYGAALATLIGYGVTLAMRLILLRKHIQLRLNWIRDGMLYLLLIVQMVLSLLGVKGIPSQVVVLVCIILLCRKEAREALNVLYAKLRRH